MDDKVSFKDAIFILEKSRRELSGESMDGIDEHVEKACSGKPPYCSFCGKGRNQVEAMVAGPEAHICSECVLLCSQIIEGRRA